MSNSKISGWKNRQKNGCQKMSKSYGGPKQAIMVQKWPFLKPKSKLKSNIHQSCGTKRSLFSWIVPKNLKKTRNFDYFILLFWKNKLKFDAKESIYSFFCSKKVTFLGFLRAKYSSKWNSYNPNWMKISNCCTEIITLLQ